MPHQTLKIIAGVDTNKTPALNEAAISSCDLIRFIPDRNNLGLPQKLGGWDNLIPTFEANSTVRSLWAWEDLNAIPHLGIGAESALYEAAGNPPGAPSNISPQQYTANITIDVSTVSGSSTVTIVDSNSYLTGLDAVYISTQISIGGLVLYGLYPISYLTVNSYTIQALDVLGTPALATSTVNNAGAVPAFTTTASSNSVSIALTAHGYSAGETFPVFVPTYVGGILLSGNYIIDSITSANAFTIQAENSAASGATVSMNGGKAQYIYYIGAGVLPVTTGYGIGVYGGGGYGLGVAVSAGRVLTPTAAAGTGSVATITFTGNWSVPIGSTIVIAGMVPAGYNGTQTVTAYSSSASTSSVSFSSTTTGALSTPGTITVTQWNSITTSLSNYVVTPTAASGTGSVATISFADTGNIPVGSIIVVSGVNNTSAGYNGTQTVTVFYAGPSNSQVSYASAETAALSATDPGTITASRWNSLSTADWTLDNWGETLIATPFNGGIYEYNPSTGNTNAAIIPQAPYVNHGAIVAMPQRQIIAWGSTFTGIYDPMLIRWCDVNNYSDWIASVTNQAGSYRIPKGSRIVGGIQGPQQALIWTDLGIWAMQYAGQPYVYQFNEVGSGCGLIARKAAGAMGGIVYWMGQSQFYRMAGSGVEPIACPVWDVIFQDLDNDNLDKIRVATNSRFGEIAWYYPTTGSGEVDKYVKYNIVMNQWDFGTLRRTAWINESIFGPPIGANDTIIYQHETSPNANGLPMSSSFTTGYFALSEADQKIFVDEVWPDMKWGYYGDDTPNANVNITFYARDFPSQTPTVYGPYTMTNSSTWFNPRIRARLLAIKISSDDIDSWWRLGGIRYRSQPDGKY